MHSARNTQIMAHIRRCSPLWIWGFTDLKDASHISNQSASPPTLASTPQSASTTSLQFPMSDQHLITASLATTQLIILWNLVRRLGAGMPALHSNRDDGWSVGQELSPDSNTSFYRILKLLHGIIKQNSQRVFDEDPAPCEHDPAICKFPGHKGWAVKSSILQVQKLMNLLRRQQLKIFLAATARLIPPRILHLIPNQYFRRPTKSTQTKPLHLPSKPRSSEHGRLGARIHTLRIMDIILNRTSGVLV
jgi:hypothetical protein